MTSLDLNEICRNCDLETKLDDLCKKVMSRIEEIEFQEFSHFYRGNIISVGGTPREPTKTEWTKYRKSLESKLDAKMKSARNHTDFGELDEYLTLNLMRIVGFILREKIQASELSEEDDD